MELVDVEMPNGARIFVGLTMLVAPGQDRSGAPLIGESILSHLALPAPLRVKGSPSEVADRLRGHAVVRP